MQDDGEVPVTSLDSKVDAPVKEPRVPKEKYKGGVANKATPIPNTEKANKRSWTMEQVDRIVENDLITSKGSKLAQFGILLDRKNDFRLQDLTTHLGGRLKRDFVGEVVKGRTPDRIREFDIQSQTMRTITANASLGTYQFNKSQVLPYMKKSLSLGYQKVDLLKTISAGIGSLETNVLSKLEAIKMNTAAPESAKASLFRKLKDEIKSHVIKKVAGNVGHVVLQGYDKQYKKYVTPILNRAHEIFADDDHKTGGINGALRAASHGLNSLRHRANDIANEDHDGSPIARIKAAGARVASAALAPAVKFGQKPKLSAGVNRFGSGFLKDKVDFFASIDPFATGPVRNPLQDHLDKKASPLSGLGVPHSGTIPKPHDLTSVVSAWRSESAKTTQTIIGHLAAIQKNTGTTDDGKIKRGTGRTPPRGGPSGGSVPPPSPGLHIPGGEIEHGVEAALAGAEAESLFSRLGNMRRKKSPASPIPFKSDLSPHAKRLNDVLDKLSSHVNTLKSHAHDTIDQHRQSSQAKTHTDPLHVPTPKARLVNPPHKMRGHLARLTDHAHGLVKSIASRFPRIGKDKIHQAAGSAGHMAGKGLVGLGVAAGASAAGAAALGHQIKGKIWEPEKPKGGRSEALSDLGKDHGGGGLLGGIGSTILGAGSGILADMVTKGVLGRLGFGAAAQGAKRGLASRAIGGAAKLAWGGTKLIGKGYVGGAKLAGKGAILGATKGIPLAFKGVKAATPVAWKGLKGAAGLGVKGSIGASKMGLSAAGFVGKGLAKGALNFAKSGIGIGIGAGIAKHFVDKYTTGGVKRAGDTLADMAQYGAIGMELGGPWGAAIGAAVGAVVANSDLIATGFHKLGSGIWSIGSTIGSAATGIWHSLFGEKAKVRANGIVDQQEKLGLFGNIKAAFFGQKAKYSKTGALVSPEKTSWISSIRSGLQKLMFGDKDSKGHYKKGSSTLDQIGSSVSDFMKGMKDRIGKTSVGSAVGSAAAGVGKIAESAWTGIKDTASSAASAVSSAASTIASDVSAGASYVGKKAADIGSSAISFVGKGISNIKDALTKIIGYEGGPKLVTDTGGLTKYGISAKANPGVDIAHLTEDQARDIYIKKYAAPLNLGQYSPQVAFVALDAAINQGPGYAKKLLAQAGNDPAKMINLRRQMYADLAAKNPGKYGKYLKGWNARMDKLVKDMGGVTKGAAMGGAASGATTASVGSGGASASGGGSSASAGSSSKGTSSVSNAFAGPTNTSLMAPSKTPQYKPLSSSAATAAAFAAAPSPSSGSASANVSSSPAAVTPKTTPVSMPSSSSSGSSATSTTTPSIVQASYTPPSYSSASSSASSDDTPAPPVPHKKSTASSGGGTGGGEMAKLIAALAANVTALNANTTAIQKGGQSQANPNQPQSTQNPQQMAPGSNPASASGSSTYTTPGTTSSNPTKPQTPQGSGMGTPIIMPVGGGQPQQKPPVMDNVMSMKKEFVQTGVMT